MIHLSGTRFGEISLEDSAEITFENGIIGFSQETRFALLERPTGPIAYLQSIITPRLALPVVDATILRPAYPNISLAEIAAITGAKPEHMAILVVVAVDAGDAQLRANLLAPVVIDVESRRGRQIILEGTSYSASTPIGNKKPQKPAIAAVASATSAASAER